MSANEFDLPVSCPGLSVGGIGYGVLKMAIAAWYRNVTGIIPTDDTSPPELLVAAQSTPDMTVKVAPGACIIGGVLDGLEVETTSPTFVAPSTNDVIVIVQLAAGVLTLKYGAESATPSAPSVDAGNIKLAEVLLTTAHTTVTGGDLTDSRVAV